MIVSKNRAVRGLAATAAILLLSACDPVIGTVSGPVRHATLTSSSGMTYRYAGNRSVVFAQPGAPSSDINVREVFWYQDSRYLTDEQACATWNTVAVAGAPGLLQPGIALRIAPVEAGAQGVRAITVTQNIYFGAIWLFNVHVWNSSDVSNPFTQVGQFDLSPIVGTLLGPDAPGMVPAPWHICARAVGASLRFMVWTGSNPMPSWDDPARTFTVALPAGWTYAGYTGGYIGHLHPNEAAAFTQVSGGPFP